MSKSPRGLKQNLFDFTIILVILIGLTIYAFQKGRLKFSYYSNLATTPPSFSTTVNQNEPKTYVDNNFLFQFIYPQKPEGCDKQISVSTPWVMNNDVYGVSVYCDEGTSLVQVLAQQSDQDIVDWWYSLLPENKQFFDEYGEMKDTVFAGQESKQISYQKNGENEHFNQVETIFHYGKNNYLIVALDYACSVGQDCWQGTFEQDILKSFKLLPEESLTPTPASTEDQICGGILGRTCPDGYTCQYEENYPDATGKCIKN